MVRQQCNWQPILSGQEKQETIFIRHLPSSNFAIITAFPSSCHPSPPCTSPTCLSISSHHTASGIFWGHVYAQVAGPHPGLNTSIPCHISALSHGYIHACSTPQVHPHPICPWIAAPALSPVVKPGTLSLSDEGVSFTFFGMLRQCNLAPQRHPCSTLPSTPLKVTSSRPTWGF